MLEKEMLSLGRLGMCFECLFLGGRLCCGHAGGRPHVGLLGALTFRIWLEISIHYTAATQVHYFLKFHKF
jgi:hypothetical protein